jgi:hypothetical protein
MTVLFVAIEKGIIGAYFIVALSHKLSPSTFFS